MINNLPIIVLLRPNVNYKSIVFDKEYSDEEFIYLKPNSPKTHFGYLEHLGNHISSYEIVYGSYFSVGFRCSVDSKTYIKILNDNSSFEKKPFGIIDFDNQKISYLNPQKVFSDPLRKNTIIIALIICIIIS